MQVPEASQQAPVGVSEHGSGVAAQNVLAEHFPGGAGQPVAVVGDASAAAPLRAALERVPGIAQVSPPQTKDGLVFLQGTLAGEPDSAVRFELRPDGDGTILALDHRGLPPGSIAGYGAGWHSHLDSLDAHLAGGEADWTARFQELGPAYAASAKAIEPVA